MSRSACENSREVGPEGGESSKERRGKETVGAGGRTATRVETEEASCYYQFACLRSFGLPLSSFHLGDTGGLFPPIYFSTPIRDPQRSLLLPSYISSRGRAQGTSCQGAKIPVVRSHIHTSMTL